jgi:adhesin/invasin
VATLVSVIGVGKFLAPDITQRIWSEADKYYEARLPTREELQQLLIYATSSPEIYANEGYVGNAEMCSVYGWPLYGRCQGIVNGYWSSTPNSVGYHYGVGLGCGDAISVIDSTTLQVACVS